VLQIESRTTYQPVEAFCAASRLSYLHVGAGPETVVLLHGWGACKEVWWSTLVALAQLGRVFAPDLPGHGGSPIHGCNRMAQLAARIGEFCDAQSLQAITLVGHSLGGNVALELALARPELLQRLVLVDAAALSTEMPIYSGSQRTNTMQRWAALRASVALAQKVGVVGRYIPHIHRGGFVLPALRRAGFLARGDVDALHQQLESLFANPLGARLSDVRVARRRRDPRRALRGGARRRPQPDGRAAAGVRAGHGGFSAKRRTTNDDRPTTNDR
jgi:pimeloyl-ACP methyl ester carboxylesterase